MRRTGVTSRSTALYGLDSVTAEAETFESLRPDLLALAYRMLGEVGRAEEMVQEAWIRWQKGASDVDSPRAFLVKVVARLCLNELASARARREESRPDRLPEPIVLQDRPVDQVEVLDQISMAFLVVLQRLTPAERAVLLLHDVFDFSHAEIGELLKKNEAACRQLLARARQNVSAERRALAASSEEHRRLLRAFLKAASAGDVDELKSLLAGDAVMIADGGPHGVRVKGVRNLPKPLVGRDKIAAFVASFARRPEAPLQQRECELNGRPAIVATQDGLPVVAILLSVADCRIRRVFFQADPERLRRVGLMH
jgi:RNA polymerase sigma-70 factor (ECF subfamily)